MGIYRGIPLQNLPGVREKLLNIKEDGGVIQGIASNYYKDLENIISLDPSLIVVPHGVKENVLYSIRPNDGSTNLILQSENFTVSPWTLLATPNVTRTANVGTAPDGTNTATLLTCNTDLSSRGIRQNIILSPTQKQYVFSCWVRSDDGAVITIDIGDSGTKFFNLTPTWERVSVLSTPSSSGFVDIAFTSNQLGKTFYIWGGQLEEGTTPGNYIKTTTRPILKGSIGDLDVIRATTATRVNEQGLIEPVPYNLFSYSEDFGNSFWTKTNLTITANTNRTMSPIGTNTVDLYIPNTTLGEHPINPVFSSSNSSIYINSTNTYNWSIYVKSAGNDFFLLRVKNINGSWSSVVFNIVSSSIVSLHPNLISADIKDVGDGWRLISCVFSGVYAQNTFQYVSSPTGEAVFSGDGTSGTYIWGAQLTIGESKREYFATTDRLNVPRIDYSNGSPAILSEPQRTNLRVQSENFNINWTKTNVSTTPNTTVSPDGRNNGTTLSVGIDASSTRHRLLQQTTYTTGTTYNGSFFLKRATHDWVQICGVNGFDGTVWANFNIKDGTVGNFGTNTIASIENYGNGWFRCSISGIPNSTGTFTGIELVTTNNLNSSRYPSYQSNSIEDVCYVWGSQLEVGSNMTSYIPTSTTIVTRNADHIYKNGIPNLIGQTEGTIFLDFDRTLIQEGFKSLLHLYSVINEESFHVQTSNNVLTHINITIISNVNNVNINRNIELLEGRNKLAVVYSTSGTKIFLNGVQLTPLVNTVLPVMNTINLSNRTGSRIYGPVRLFSLWKTKLTDQQAIQLTTL